MKPSRNGRFLFIVATGLIVILAGVFSLQVQPAGASMGYDHVVDVWERAWNEILASTPAGQYYEAVFAKYDNEIDLLLSRDPVHVMMFWLVAEKFVPGLEAMLDGKGDTVKITEEQIQSMEEAMEWLASMGSEPLRNDIQAELQRFPLEQFVGMTMNEALDYLNANLPPPPQPENGPDSGNGSTPPPENQCVAGYTADCMSGPSLVPGSDGRWAFYVLNGVYFEYPSEWRVELWAGRTDIVSMIPVTDSPESVTADEISLFAGAYPNAIVSKYDPLTYPQQAWLRPPAIWKRLVTLPDLTGSEFLWVDSTDTSFLYVEAMFYDPDTQTAAGMVMPARGELLDAMRDPDFVQDKLPNFRHIVESVRMAAPDWVSEVTPEATTSATYTRKPLPTPETGIGPTQTKSEYQCLAGSAPACPPPTIVPDSNGEWVYYILNGVYFEYPSQWDIEQNYNRDEVHFRPSPESPEGKNTSLLVIQISFSQIPEWPANIADLFPAWERPNTIWRELIGLQDFDGFENLWRLSDTLTYDLEFFFYNKNQQIQVGVVAKIDAATAEKLTTQQAALEMFPSIHHITNSLRISNP